MFSRLLESLVDMFTTVSLRRLASTDYSNTGAAFLVGKTSTAKSGTLYVKILCRVARVRCMVFRLSL